MEKRYKFRKELTTPNVHIDFDGRSPLSSELSLKNGVVFNGAKGAVIEHAISDFNDYLFKSFNLKPCDSPIVINVELTENGLEDVCSYKGRVVTVSEKSIEIKAFDERGAAQAIYDLEDVMTSKKAPYLDLGKTKNKPLFSPRMTHSAYGFDVFPDKYIQILAKRGIDALILFVKGVNQVAMGEFDINAFCDKAASYGMDVYAYSYHRVFCNPNAPDAEKRYSEAYGELFKAHPKLKGVILVGESVQFPSTDERTTGRTNREYLNEDNFPDPKPASGWWPCRDFPDWVRLVQKVIYKEKPDADVVFWTYNWGWAPEKDRVELLNNLPTDISLLVTFEMFQNLPTQYGITERVCDYSVAFAGPGDYFLSEAKVAKERGIKLYTMCNAGGKTWDFGVMPYEPFPQQWQDRYEALKDCREKFGLSGIMECHHYGYYPSFINKIEKKSFDFYRQDRDAILREVIDEFSSGQTDECIKAFEYWSNAIRIYMPTDDEQYCAMRVGPAYPLMLSEFPIPPKQDGEDVIFGPGIMEEYHLQSGRMSAEGKFTLHSIRIRTEIKILRDMINLMRKGLKIFKALKNKTPQLRKIINLGEYIVCCLTTNIHVKQMYINRQKLFIAGSKREVSVLINNIKKIGVQEIRNAEKALKVVDKDSAIGYEPSMGYLGDRVGIEWKIRQVKHMMEHELGIYEKGLKF